MGAVLQAEGTHLEILLHTHAREHVAAFRNVRHAKGHNLVAVRFEQVNAIEHHGAGLRRSQARDGVQRGRFAGAVCADQRYDLTVVHGKADVFDRFDRPVGDAQILDFQHQASLPSAVSSVSSAPRYAEITCGSLAISSGSPDAMVRP